MPDSSILGGEVPQRRAAGRDTDALGPSDSSDSGSDVQGESPMATGADQPDELGAVPVDTSADSDRSGTGERASATGDAVDGADIRPDRITRDPTLADHEEDNDALADSDDFAASADEDENAGDPSAERIDADDEQALADWADKLDTTPEQLRDAIDEVGDLAADVEMHLKGSHSTTNADRVEDAGGT